MEGPLNESGLSRSMDTKFGIGGTTRKLAESIILKDVLWTSILPPWFLVTADAPTAGRNHE